MTALDPRALRNAFGSFMTGVTVVTTLRSDGTPVGFTANSFSSVSLDPPLLLVCPGKYLSSYDSFVQCSHFAVNVLSEGQEDVSNIFSSYKGDRFARVPHDLDRNGVPLIGGATVQFSCRTHQSIPAGDHCILIGQIEDFVHTEAMGLGYVGGQYFSLGLERAAFEPASGQPNCGAIIEDGDRVWLESTPQGLRPPQIALGDRSQLLLQMREMLVNKGFAAELGQAYSIFEDTKRRQHYTYFLATGHCLRPDENIVPVPIADLPDAPFATPAIARMMTRFALEQQTRNFALYLGDTEDGAIHNATTRM